MIKSASGTFQVMKVEGRRTMALGLWALIPTLIIAAAFIVLGGEKKWPGPWGWALCILGIGIMVADGFHSWTPVSIALLMVGNALGWAGVLTSSNSPAK